MQASEAGSAGARRERAVLQREGEPSRLRPAPTGQRNVAEGDQGGSPKGAKLGANRAQRNPWLSYGKDNLAPERRRSCSQLGAGVARRTSRPLQRPFPRSGLLGQPFTAGRAWLVNGLSEPVSTGFLLNQEGALMSKSTETMEKIVALCRRRGFIFGSSEIYGGIGGFWDYGPLGCELKRNIKDAWWHAMVYNPPPHPRGLEYEMVGVDCSIIMNRHVGVASRHARHTTKTTRRI